MLSDELQIRNAGFSGFVTIRDLRAARLRNVPEKAGVYLILRFANDPVEFLTVSSGGHFKNEDPTVALEVLRSNWITNTPVLYIGKAGAPGKKATLQSRLREYLDFGTGKRVAHRGGRLIWQVAGSEDLIVCWKHTPNEVPRSMEGRMIQEFKAEHGGRRPFANLQD